MPATRRRRSSRRVRRLRRAKSRNLRRSRSRKQRGGADIPKGYDDVMAVSYTPTSDKLGDPDMVPRIGGVSAFHKDTDSKRESALEAEVASEVVEAAAAAAV